MAARSGAVADGIRTGKLEYAAVRGHSPDANGNFAVAFEMDDHECKRCLAEMLIFDAEVEHGKLKQPPQYNSDDDNACALLTRRLRVDSRRLQVCPALANRESQ